jgi:hypothetical protein
MADLTLSETTKLLEDSDKKLDALFGSVKKVRHVADRMNEEISSQDPLIKNLSSDTETTTNHLERRNRAIDDVAEESKKCCGSLMYYVFIGAEVIVIILIVATWNLGRQTG